MTTTMIERLDVGIECITALIGACEDQRETIDQEVDRAILADESPTDIFIRKLDAVRGSMESLRKDNDLRKNNEDGS